MTNIDLIKDALLELGVINEVEIPSSEQGAHALRRLNQMIEAWDEDGTRLGYFEQTDTTADCPIPRWAERAVTCKLAIALAPSYGGAASVTPALVDECDRAHNAMLRRLINAQLHGADMTHLGGVVTDYDINSGQ